MMLSRIQHRVHVMQSRPTNGRCDMRIKFTFDTPYLILGGMTEIFMPIFGMFKTQTVIDIPNNTEY